MNIKLSYAAWAFAGLLTIAACKNDKESEETKPAETAAAAEPQPTEEPSSEPTAEAPAGPEVAPRIKAEVDNKEPTAGHTVTLAATGAKGTFTAPTGWKAAPSGEMNVAKSADGKSAFAVSKYADGDDTTALATKATGALGYTDCKWGTPGTATIGKDKLAGDVADGVCKQGDTVVRVAYATIAGPNSGIMAVGGWHDGTDANALFNTFRTGKKGATGDATGIAACCQALRQNAASAPIQYKTSYLAAAAMCSQAMSNPQGRAALAQVRAALAGAKVPSSCR